MKILPLLILSLWTSRLSMRRLTARLILSCIGGLKWCPSSLCLRVPSRPLVLLLLILRLLPWAIWKMRRRSMLTLGNSRLRRLVTMLLSGMKCEPFIVRKWLSEGGIPIWVNNLEFARGPFMIMVRPSDNFETQGNGRVGLMVRGASIGQTPLWNSAVSPVWLLLLSLV